MIRAKVRAHPIRRPRLRAPLIRVLTAALAGAVCAWGGASAQSRTQTAPAAQSSPAPAAQGAAQGAARGPGLGTLGANTRDPIKIDADRLDVFDKEQRAVFAGNVVAVQGESTIKCAELTVLYEQQRGQNRSAAAASPGEGAIRRIDCKGPVTIVSRTQTATGDNAVFDRTANQILLTGNVALSDGQNVTTGERIVYDLNTAVANVVAKPEGRVRALIVPGSGSQGAQGASGGQSGQAPPPQGSRRPATN